LAGKPLLIHAIERVKGLVDEVVVCVNDERRKEKYSQALREQGLLGVCLVVDEKCGISGPTVAIMSGLKAVKTEFCLTLPCDMPFLEPKVAEVMFHEAEEFDVATPMWPNGRLETLLNVLRRDSAIEITQTLCSLNHPRSDDIQRGAGKLLLISPVNHIRTLDPDLKSFININSKQDLKRLQTRRAHGLVTEDRRLSLGDLLVSDLHMLRDGTKMLAEGKFEEAQEAFAMCVCKFGCAGSFFWAGASGEKLGETLLKMSQELGGKVGAELDLEGKEAFVEAANNYRIEAEMYEENSCRLLSERALADKDWCESWAMGKSAHPHRYPSKVGR
jgi:molybdopterin-guanine dinucleotide biosynthesis protein A